MRISPRRLELGEPRWRTLVRLFILIAVVGLYYASLVSGNLSGASAPASEALSWVWWVFPIFLITYLVGIVRNLRRELVFVFDTVTGEIRKNGVAILRLDQVAEVRLRAVNGVCEELSLSVQDDQHGKVELPIEGSLNQVARVANAIADMSGVQVLFVTE